MTAPLQRLSTWLCLLTALLGGVTAGRALVLCLEPGGAVNLEAALVGPGCDGCTESQDPTAPADSEAEHAAPCCACVDVALDLAVNGVRTRLAEARSGFGMPAALPAPPVSAFA
jgi:hypothetical protein